MTTIQQQQEHEPVVKEPAISRKVVIVGAGDVGASFAYALLQSGIAASLVLIDSNHELANGQALDLSHGLPFVPAPIVRTGSPDDYADATVIVVTAGSKQKPGESRLDLLKRNTGILDQIIDEIKARESPAVVVVTTNPVDVLTFEALRRTGWPRNRIFGSGTVLDSARFVWGYALLWFLLNDRMKLLAYRIFDPVKAVGREIV